MKVFYFDVETGIFQGEGFERETCVRESDGITTCEPPCPAQGLVPVFDPRNREWILRRIDVAHCTGTV